MNKNILLGLSLFLFFGAGFFAGNLYTTVQINDIELPERNITINVSRPDIVNNHSFNPTIENNNDFEPERFFYIQPPNTDIEISSNNSYTKVRTNELITVHGSSMRPTMWTGNTVLAQETNGEDLDEGTIVSNGNITHRIKADYTETNGYYLTQGDNNERYEKMTPSEIKYRIIGVIFTDDES